MTIRLIAAIRSPPMFEVAAIMPAYNEEACVEDTVRACVAALADTGESFRVFVLDDGSTDCTPNVLRRFAGDPCVEVLRKENSGHGPTILAGYRHVAHRARWVFQLDSDDEVPAANFAALWAVRHCTDAIVGVRAQRRQPLFRCLVTRGSRLAVRLLYGNAVADVNCPFRLIRGEVLVRFIDRIPADTFAPNVVVSGFLAKEGYRVANVVVPVASRATKTAALKGWKAVATGLLALQQTVAIRRNARVSARG